MNAKPRSLAQMLGNNPDGMLGPGDGDGHAVPEAAPPAEPSVTPDDEPVTVEAEPIEAPPPPSRMPAVRSNAAVVPGDVFLMACGDGLPLSLERAKLDILESAGRMLEDYVRIGKRLFLIKQSLQSGQFMAYLDEEFPLSARVAQECMLIARRVVEHELDPRRGPDYRALSAGSKQKALLLMGVSDEEQERAAQSGDLMGIPLEEIGEMSYRQLRDELRKAERDRDRARGQRDKAESKIDDLREENDKLRGTPGRQPQEELSPLARAHVRTLLDLGTLLGAAQDAAAQEAEEIIRDGTGMVSSLQRLLDQIQPYLMPFDPADNSEPADDVPLGGNGRTFRGALPGEEDYDEGAGT